MRRSPRSSVLPLALFALACLSLDSVAYAHLRTNTHNDRQQAREQARQRTHQRAQQQQQQQKGKPSWPQHVTVLSPDVDGRYSASDRLDLQGSDSSSRLSSERKNVERSSHRSEQHAQHNRVQQAPVVQITSVQMVDVGELVTVEEGQDVHVTVTGMIVIEGNEASFQIPQGNLYLDGLLNVVLEEHGTEDAVWVHGELILESATARFSIDASSFVGPRPGSNDMNQVELPLVRYTSHSGSFEPQQVIIMGLHQGWSAEVVTGDDALELILTRNAPLSPATAQQQDGAEDMSSTTEQDAVDYRTAYLLFSQTSVQDTHRRFHALQ